MNQNETRLDHHRATTIGTIAAVHFLLSVALFLLSLASSNLRFDGGGPSDLTALLLNSTFKMLSFPLLTAAWLLKTASAGVWGWLWFLGNSVLWGWAGWRAIRFWRSRQGGALDDL